MQKVAEAGENDVLFGRGSSFNRHHGNIQYRSIVSSHRAGYRQGDRKEKREIVEKIFNAVKSTNGLFLHRIDNAFDWTEVPDARAKMKISQALREGLDIRGFNRKRGQDQCDSDDGRQKTPPAAVPIKKRKGPRSVGSGLDQDFDERGQGGNNRRTPGDVHDTHGQFDPRTSGSSSVPFNPLVDGAQVASAPGPFQYPNESNRACSDWPSPSTVIGIQNVFGSPCADDPCWSASDLFQVDNAMPKLPPMIGDLSGQDEKHKLARDASFSKAKSLTGLSSHISSGRRRPGSRLAVLSKYLE